MSSSHQRPGDAEFYRAALHDIIGLAADLARRIHAAAAAPEPTLSLDAASIALDRTARTLRRTVLLAARLDAPPDRADRRRQVIRQVEDAIFRAARDAPERRDSLAAEFEDRLDRPEFEQDLLARPVADLVQDICRDLALATLPGARPAWRRRTPDDVARLAARAAAPPASPPPPPPRQPPAEPWPLRHRSQTAPQC